MEGTQIGTYRIERKLGAGGMGVVYVGVDVRLGRRAAIKQLLPEMSTQREIVERFFNEAKAAASINHPGIVEIYDVGWHDGSAYFAMKLLDGESLGARIRRGPISPDQACAVARQVASALAAAHAAGIVHRDLKPDNIILVPDDEVATGDRAMILDFGIAKLFGDQGMTAKTRTGSVMGTPSYMSPEQCRGAGEVDHRTDIYALGCILFEMLAGRTPFVGTGVGEILGMHQFVEAPTLRSLRGDVPPELEAIAMRCLDKDPAKRYQTMTELVAALRAFSSHGASAQVAAVRGRSTGGEVAAIAPVPTTISTSGGELAKPEAPAPSRRRIVVPAAIGSVVIAVVVIAVVAMSKKSSRGDVASPVAREAVHDGPADTAALASTTIDANEVPPLPIDAASVVDPAVRRRDLEDQATAARLERRWDDLARLGHDLNRADLAAAAAREQEAERALADEQRALAQGDRAAAIAAAKRIPAISVYREAATRALSNAGPAPRTDAPRNHMDRALELEAQSKFAEALDELEVVVARSPTNLDAIRHAYGAACKSKNEPKAKLYFARLPDKDKTILQFVCIKNHVNVP